MKVYMPSAPESLIEERKRTGRTGMTRCGTESGTSCPYRTGNSKRSCSAWSST
jgi:hypothetical protein